MRNRSGDWLRQAEADLEMDDPFIRRVLREGVLLWSDNCP